MPLFEYKAVNKKGKQVADVLDATDANAAVHQVRALGLFPLHVAEAGKPKGLGKASAEKPGEKFSLSSLSFGQRVKTRDLVLFIRQFASLNAAGVPLLRALKVLWEQQRPGPLKNTVSELQTAIESGSTLSEAMSKHPKVFNRLFISMMRAAEAAGVMDTVLLRMADYFEKSARLKARIRSALVYPIVVVLAAIAVMLFLMVFIIPKFAEMFADMELKLPALTRGLITVSHLFMTWYFWLGMAAVVAGGIVAVRLFAATATGRYKLDEWKLKVPVFGQILHKVAVARFARTLGTLTTSGVAILKALVIVKDTIGNEVFARAINHVSESIREGESIADPLRQSKVFSPVVINMIAIGEETGRLDEILVRVADQYDEEVDVMITTLTTLLEPFLIVTLAVIVGTIVISLFLPLISLISSLSQGGV